MLVGVFSKVSGALEQREQTSKTLSANAARPELSSLTDAQQLIVRFLRDGIPNAEQGATIQAIQAELSDIAHLPELLAELVKSGWITVAGQGAGQIYKAASRVERGSRLLQALNAGRPELSSLPEEQQLIVRFLRDGIPDAEQGATIQAIQAELSEIAHLPDVLAELVKSGWVTLAGHFYKAAPRIERGSRLLQAINSTSRGDKSAGSSSIFSRIKVD